MLTRLPSTSLGAPGEGRSTHGVLPPLEAILLEAVPLTPEVAEALAPPVEVTSADGKIVYKEGRDYDQDGGHLLLVEGGRIAPGQPLQISYPAPLPPVPVRPALLAPVCRSCKQSMGRLPSGGFYCSGCNPGALSGALTGQVPPDEFDGFPEQHSPFCSWADIVNQGVAVGGSFPSFLPHEERTIRYGEGS